MEKQGYRENIALIAEAFPGQIAISVDEAAKVMGVNRNTVYEAVKRKVNPIPSQKVNRKRIVIPVAGLARWLCGR